MPDPEPDPSHGRPHWAGYSCFVTKPRAHGIWDVSDFMPLIANKAVDIAEIGEGTSGITGAMQVADLAYAFELPVYMMNCPFD